MHMPRMLHAIYENKAGFLLRNSKTKSRLELEGESHKKSFWCDVADTFNDKAPSLPPNAVPPSTHATNAPRTPDAALSWLRQPSPLAAASALRL